MLHPYVQRETPRSIRRFRKYRCHTTRTDSLHFVRRLLVRFNIFNGKYIPKSPHCQANFVRRRGDPSRRRSPPGPFIQPRQPPRSLLPDDLQSFLKGGSRHDRDEIRGHTISHEHWLLLPALLLSDGLSPGDKLFCLANVGNVDHPPIQRDGAQALDLRLPEGLYHPSCVRHLVL